MLITYRAGLILMLSLLSLPAWAVSDVGSTRHNLSLSGPGTIKSATIDQVCVFCHTPHNAAPEAPLWNRTMSSGQTYDMYTSDTLPSLAEASAPTGKSNLCLACHDGTVALGAFINPPTGVTNDLASTLLTSRGNLTTDLQDDHPISFVYDANLIGPRAPLGTPPTRDPELHNPANIGLPLDNNRIECTTCHDPHEATLDPFLRKPTLNGAICTSCHNKTGWSTSSHATSTATPSGANPWADRRPEWRGTNVAENACMNCHTPHTAGTPQRLLKLPEENTCYTCHNGTVAASDIEADFAKTYRHPVEVDNSTTHLGTLFEDPATMPRHVECADCHNPHKVAAADPMVTFDPNNTSAATTTPPLANANIQGVSGIDSGGNVVAEVTNQYELCFKCHGRGTEGSCGGVPGERCPTTTTRGHRKWPWLDIVPIEDSTDPPETVPNIRERLVAGPESVSRHPVVELSSATASTDVPSLRTDLAGGGSFWNSRYIYCTDCHNANSSRYAAPEDPEAPVAKSGTNGPHGSDWESIMGAQYDFNNDNSSGDPPLYAVCLTCHDWVRLTSNLSGFNHNAHISARNGNCQICHDPHGSPNARLNAFMYAADAQVAIDCVRNKGGGAQACDPSAGGGVAVWEDLGTFTGQCYLSCHGTGHSPKTY